jgi:hypothetical protein
MKRLNFTRHQRNSTLQSLRSRKLLLDRTIRELETLVSATGPLPLEEQLLPTVPADDTTEQWLQ